MDNNRQENDIFQYISPHHYNFNQPQKYEYIKIAKVGAGAYGDVYKAKHIKDENKTVALKKIKISLNTKGFPITSLREIRILKACNHPNIVKLIDIASSKPAEENDFRGSSFFVFEYLEHDLHALKYYHFSIPQIKCILQQILQGVAYMHSKNIIHRDLKRIVKIADFGLARYMNSSSGTYTQKVVTLWYRAPEILLGDRKYTHLIDIWSVGCIFAELILKETLFKGDQEENQMELITELCGNPNEFNWPGSQSLPYYRLRVPNKECKRELNNFMKKKKPSVDDLTLDLLDKMLTLDPKQRINAVEALQHPYFTSEPLPTDPSKMPQFDQDYHECTMEKNKNPRAINPQEPKIHMIPNGIKENMELSNSEQNKDQQQKSSSNTYTKNSIIKSQSKWGNSNTQRDQQKRYQTNEDNKRRRDEDQVKKEDKNHPYKNREQDNGNSNSNNGRLFSVPDYDNININDSWIRDFTLATKQLKVLDTKENNSNNDNNIVVSSTTQLIKRKSRFSNTAAAAGANSNFDENDKIKKKTQTQHILHIDTSTPNKDKDIHKKNN